jgi:hypothetical protein
LICICGQNLTINDIKILYEFFEFNQSHFIEQLKKILYFKFLETCSECNIFYDLSSLKEIKNEEIYRITLNEKSEGNFKVNYDHIICKNCYQKDRNLKG